MKALKILGLTLLVLGLVLGAFYLSFGRGEVVGATKKNTTAQRLEAGVTAAWGRATWWDEATYAGLHNRIDQNLSMEAINEAGHAALIAHLDNTATAKLDSLLRRLWQQPDCAKPQVDELYQGVVFMQGRMHGDERLADLADAYGLYTDMHAFVHASYSRTPHLSGGTSWTPFSHHRSNVTAQARRYASHPTYRSMLSNIDELRDGLARVPEKLNTAQRRYYAALVRQVKRYYAGRHHSNPAARDSLRAVVDRISYEAGAGSSAASELRSYLNY